MKTQRKKNEMYTWSLNQANWFEQHMSNVRAAHLLIWSAGMISCSTTQLPDLLSKSIGSLDFKAKSKRSLKSIDWLQTINSVVNINNSISKSDRLRLQTLSNCFLISFFFRLICMAFRYVRNASVQMELLQPAATPWSFRNLLVPCSHSKLHEQCNQRKQTSRIKFISTLVSDRFDSF